MTDSIEYLVQADIDFPMEYQDTHVMIKNHLKLFVLLLTLQLACILGNFKFAALNIVICLYLVSYQIWKCIVLLNSQFELRAVVDSTEDDDQEVDEDDQDTEEGEAEDDDEGEGEAENDDKDEFKQEEHPTDEQPSGDNADDESEVVESIPAPADIPIPVSEDETEPEEPVPVPNLPQVRRRGRRATKQT